MRMPKELMEKLHPILPPKPEQSVPLHGGLDTFGDLGETKEFLRDFWSTDEVIEAIDPSLAGITPEQWKGVEDQLMQLGYGRKLSEVWDQITPENQDLIALAWQWDYGTSGRELPESKKEGKWRVLWDREDVDDRLNTAMQRAGVDPSQVQIGKAAFAPGGGGSSEVVVTGPDELDKYLRMQFAPAGGMVLTAQEQTEAVDINTLEVGDSIKYWGPPSPDMVTPSENWGGVLTIDREGNQVEIETELGEFLVIDASDILEVEKGEQHGGFHDPMPSPTKPGDRVKITDPTLGVQLAGEVVFVYDDGDIEVQLDNGDTRVVASAEVEKEEVSPPGWGGTVKGMKDEPGIDNPWALAWWMKDKGYKSHKPDEALEQDDEPEPDVDLDVPDDDLEEGDRVIVEGEGEGTIIDVVEGWAEIELDDGKHTVKPVPTPSVQKITDEPTSRDFSTDEQRVRVLSPTTLNDGTELPAGSEGEVVDIIESGLEVPDALVRFDNGAELQIPADEVEAVEQKEATLPRLSTKDVVDKLGGKEAILGRGLSNDDTFSLLMQTARELIDAGEFFPEEPNMQALGDWVDSFIPV
jgi:hypothetical protein